MKLETLINYLLNAELLQNWYKNENLNLDSEALLIYMKHELHLDSEIKIFEIEETKDKLTFEKGGVTYIQVLPIDYAITLIHEDLALANKGISDLDIAKRLLEYRIFDA